MQATAKLWTKLTFGNRPKRCQGVHPTVKEVMSANPACCAPEDGAQNAAKIGIVVGGSLAVTGLVAQTPKADDKQPNMSTEKGKENGAAAVNPAEPGRYDQNGHEIVRDTSTGSNSLVQFVPRWTGPFRVRIVNLGYVYSNYILMTN
jgi:hypothetical protein